MLKTTLRTCVFLFISMALLSLDARAEREYIHEPEGPIRQDKEEDTANFLFRSDVGCDLADRYYAGSYGITDVSNCSMVGVRDVKNTRDAAAISFTADFSYQHQEPARSFVYLLVIRNNDYTWKAIADYRTTTSDMLKQHGLYKEAKEFRNR